MVIEFHVVMLFVQFSSRPESEFQRLSLRSDIPRDRFHVIHTVNASRRRKATVFFFLTYLLLYYTFFFIKILYYTLSSRISKQIQSGIAQKIKIHIVDSWLNVNWMKRASLRITQYKNLTILNNALTSLSKSTQSVWNREIGNIGMCFST